MLNIRRKGIAGRSSSKYKGSRVEASFRCWNKNRKSTVSWVEWTGEMKAGDKIREVRGLGRGVRILFYWVSYWKMGAKKRNNIFYYRFQLLKSISPDVMKRECRRPRMVAEGRAEGYCNYAWERWWRVECWKWWDMGEFYVYSAVKESKLFLTHWGCGIRKWKKLKMTLRS